MKWENCHLTNSLPSEELKAENAKSLPMVAQKLEVEQKKSLDDMIGL